MTTEPARRGFLRGLATLPLVGGGVTLIGAPTAAAVTITPALLDAYDEWLDLERSFLKWERWGPDGITRPERSGVEVVYRNRSTGEVFDSRPCGVVTGRKDGNRACKPSGRAAVVLSAVGCGWRQA